MPISSGLTNFLTAEVLTFNQAGGGELDADTDAYGNKNYFDIPGRPELWKNSGGREISLTPGSQQLSKAMSPLACIIHEARLPWERGRLARRRARCARSQEADRA